MLNIRKAEERGRTKIDWLNSYHSFSFGHYYDPNHVGFNSLLVINDDFVKAGGGFGEHGHKNMEIVTYVLEGELAHKDSLGNVETIKAGEVQRMSAGSGIRHSEFNYSKSDDVRFLQIWFLPEQENIDPGYEQKDFTEADKLNKLQLVVSPNGEDGALKINQDVEIYASILEKDKSLNFDAKKREIWLQVASGRFEVNGEVVKNGDGAYINAAEDLEIKGLDDKSEFLIFSMTKFSMTKENN